MDGSMMISSGEREGVRSWTLYTAFYVDAFWLALALLTVGAVWSWGKVRPRLEAGHQRLDAALMRLRALDQIQRGEILAVGAMLAWAAFMVGVVLSVEVAR